MIPATTIDADLLQRVREAGDSAHILLSMSDATAAADALSSLAQECAALREQVSALTFSLRSFGPLKQRAAEALADAVCAMVTTNQINPRSLAADALLDYRDPPRTERSDALDKLTAERDTAIRERDAALDNVRGLVAIINAYESPNPLSQQEGAR